MFLIEDSNNQILILPVLSLIFYQNFNPINLDRKLDNEKEKDMLKLVWDECITNVFITYMYSKENYDVISHPKLTYQ